MKRIKTLLGMALLTATFSSCAVGYPVLTTDNNIGSKVGESSYDIIFGIVTKGGDASIKKAAQNGDITKIATVDLVVESKLIKTTVKTIVTGE
jgi:hypothetical protein